ncbi:MAG: hypothetical protein ACLQVI_09600 [Polyangiaceae bacterium]
MNRPNAPEDEQMRRQALRDDALCEPSASTEATRVNAAGRVIVDLPGLEPESPNRRDHYLTQARQVRRTRRAVREALAPFAPPPSPWLIALVRFGPRTLDDDNATTSMKAVRDEVASWLRVNDGDRSRVRFVVVQEVAPFYGVGIGIEHVGGTP